MYDVATRAEVLADPAASLLSRRETAGCRLCGAKLRHDLIDLGGLPAAGFASPSGNAPASRLRIRLCDDCGLTQAADLSPLVPQPADAVALPSHLPGAEEAGRRQALVLIQKWRLGPGTRVVGIGAGCGDTLRHLAANGIRVEQVAAHGAATPFNAEIAMDIAVRNGRADLVLLDEAMARAAEPFEFAAGLASLVRPSGVVSIMVPDLLAVLQQGQFDAFGHDTCSTFSLKVLERLLCSVGLRVFDAERLPELGGLLRVHACPASARHTVRPGLKTVRVAEVMAESDGGVLQAGFSARVGVMREQIRDFVNIHRAAGRRVAAFGATRRSAMLLNACGLTRTEIEAVADPNPALHGLAMPGSRVPIVPPARLAEAPPHDLLLLPWSQVPECLPPLHGLRPRGTQFWTVLPRIGRI